jgi:hypothetical protein
LSHGLDGSLFTQSSVRQFEAASLPSFMVRKIYQILCNPPPPILLNGYEWRISCLGGSSPKLSAAGS